MKRLTLLLAALLPLVSGASPTAPPTSGFLFATFKGEKTPLSAEELARVEARYAPAPGFTPPPSALQNISADPSLPKTLPQ